MRKFKIFIYLGTLFILCVPHFFAAFAQGPATIETLRFRDADIRVVLQAITQKAAKDNHHVNIILGPDVKGLVTVDMENVDWETALDAVLTTYGYGYEWIGSNIILVDTLDNLAVRRKKAEAAKAVEPLTTKVFSLNFAKVADIKTTIKNALTPRGSLTDDVRTNTLIVTDVQSKVDMIEKIMKYLDSITPQVLIEAKIIETDLGVTNKLGIRWNISGTASGSKRPHTWPFTRHTNEKYLSYDNFPAASSDLFSFGTLDASQLSAILDIIFSDTHTKILSMPTITTMDNNKATIDVVTEDPIPQYSYRSEEHTSELQSH